MVGAVERNSAAFTGLGLAVGAAGAAITLGLRKAGNEAAAFEGALTRSTTLVGISADEMQRMGREALGLADTGQGPRSLADALFFAQSAGLRGAAAMEVVEASAKAASIGLGDTAVVTDLVTSAVNAYGPAALSAEQATDTLIGAVREGKAEASELAGALGQVLPVASEMGVTFDEVGAAVAGMTRTGTNAGTAAMQLRQILANLLKPAQGVEEAMTELGLSAQGLRDTIREDGLWAALMSLRDAAGDNEEALGRLFPNVRALAGFLDLTGANAAANEQIFRQMADTTGLLADGFEEWSQTTEAAQARFSASMEAARIALGEGLQGPMRAVLDLGSGMAQTFSELPASGQAVVTWGLGVAGVAATMAGGFLVAAPRIVATKAALADLAADMPRTMSALSGVGRFLKGPWGVALGTAVVAVGALIQAKADLRRRSEAFLEILGQEIDLLDRTANSFDNMSEAARRQFATQLIREHSNLIDVLKETGVTLGDVSRVLLGDTGEAYDRVTAAIEEHTNVTSLGKEGYDKLSGAGQELARILGINEKALDLTAEEQRQLNTVTEDGTGQLDNWARAAVGWREAAEAGGAATGDAADEFDGFAEQVDEATEALDRWRETQEAITDPVLSLIDAVRGVEDAKRDSERATEDLLTAERELADVQADSEATAEDLARAQRNLEDAQQKVTDTSLGTFRALEKLRLEAADGRISWEQFEHRLQEWVRQGELTAEEADNIRQEVAEARGEAERWEGAYEAEIRLQGHLEALSQLDDLADAAHLARQPVNPRVTVSGYSQAMQRFHNLEAAATSAAQAGGPVRFGGGRVHTGGEVTPSGILRFHGGGEARRYHDGATAGFGRLAADEVPAILQVGETVWSAADSAMMRSRFGTVRPDALMAGSRTDNSRTFTQHVTQTFGDASPQTVAEARHQLRILAAQNS